MLSSSSGASKSNAFSPNALKSNTLPTIDNYSCHKRWLRTGRFELHEGIMSGIALLSVAPGKWSTFAGDEWSNPGGGLWGGYAIGLCIRVVEAEPEAAGEALSLTLTYAAALPAGALDVRTGRLRQAGSLGVWSVEGLPAGTEY